MIQNSLDRLFAGMATSLRDVVLPATGDDFARSQVSACIELLGNLSTRVQWRSDQLEETTARAREAISAAVALAPTLEEAAADSMSDDPLVARDDALARVSAALRRCDELDIGDDARAPLLQFARWHLQVELALLRTGMFRE